MPADGRSIHTCVTATTQLTLLDLSKTHRAGELAVSATTFDGEP